MSGEVHADAGEKQGSVRPELTPTELVSEGAMSVAAAVRFSGYSRSTLYELMDKGEIAYIKVGRSRRIPKLELVAFLARHLVRRVS